MAIDSRTRFILAFNITKSRSSKSVYTFINEATDMVLLIPTKFLWYLYLMI